MATSVGTRVAIIGAGFSGSLLAVQLLRRFLPGGRIFLIEKNAQFGRGLAYSTGNPNHALNVRAGRMSAFADEPDHFVNWLRNNAKAKGEAEAAWSDSDQFVPRRLYGAYIQDLLGNEIWQTGNGRNLYLVPDEAVALWQHPRGMSVQVRSGRTYEVDLAVLATGNFPHGDTAGHYYANPWSSQVLAGLETEAPVLLIGTGLTMVDTVISLLDQAHRGPIYAISRRGLLPRRHGETPPQPPLPLAAIDCSSVAAMLHAVRQAVRRAHDDENAWRSVVDALRPYTQQIWQNLPTAEKRRFLRHLRPWWDVHRHRMAPAVADVIDDAVRRRQLKLQAARLQAMAPDRQGVTVTLKKRGTDELEKLRVARVIDCSGPQCDYTRIESPLVRDLLARGIARADPLNLGLDVTTESAVINRWGVPSRQIYALGPVTRGLFWEITAVPDIREQCWKVASVIEERCKAELVSEPLHAAGL
ncbi:MAG: FAD/NAD(P)-binding protein [Rhodospirillales bacterium]|nr:FAD/NAD(P)-binding protein [Rhodospirillales bacterium]